MNVTRALRIFILAATLLAAASAALAADSGSVFVESIPLGASVTMDGATIPGVTPLLVRDILPGQHVFVLSRDGYEQQSLVVEVGSEGAQRISPELLPAGISVSFPIDKSAVVGGNEVTSGQGVIQLTQSEFSLKRADGTIYVDPYPRAQRFTDAMTIAIPVMLAFGGILTWDAIARTPEGAPVLPPSVIALHASTATLIAIDIGLLVRRRRQLLEFSAVVEERGDPELERRMLSRAEAMLSRGDVEDALTEYEALVSEYPRSDVIPDALHRSAGIHYLLGNTEEAGRLYNRIVSDYPVARLYDICVKNLADLASQQGNYDAGLDYLTQIVYFDSPFSRPEIVQYAGELVRRWAEAEPGLESYGERQLEMLRRQ